MEDLVAAPQVHRREMPYETDNIMISRGEDMPCYQAALIAALGVDLDTLGMFSFYSQFTPALHITFNCVLVTGVSLMPVLKTTDTGFHAMHAADFAAMNKTLRMSRGIGRAFSLSLVQGNRKQACTLSVNPTCITPSSLWLRCSGAT